MDMKDGLIAAAIVGLGYLGIKRVTNTDSWDGTTGNDFRKYNDMLISPKDREDLLHYLSNAFRHEDELDDYYWTIEDAKRGAVSTINWFAIDKHYGDVEQMRDKGFIALNRDAETEEEGCPKCGDVEDYFINDCCDTPNCFYCGDECYVRVNNEGRPINEDHVVNCTEHQCCTEFMGGSRLYGADYNKPMPTQHWMSELAYVQRFIENLHDNYYSMIPEHLHDSLDKCYDIMDDMVKDSRKAEAAEIVEYECARCGGLGDLCRGCSGLGADYPEEFGSCDLPEFPCPYCDATGKVTSNEKAKEFSRSIGYQLERVGEGMLGFSLFPTRMYHSKEKLEKIKAHKEEIMAQVANHYGLEPAEIEEDFWWADRWERGHDEFIEEVKATNGWGDPDILQKILNNPEKWGGDEKIR